MRTFKELSEQLRLALDALLLVRGGTRRLRPTRLDRDTTDHINGLADQSEPYRRMVKNRDMWTREFGDIRNQKETDRRRALAVALDRVRHIPTLVQEFRDTITHRRRNTALSFPTALDGVDANGMIMLALLRAQIAPLLAKASAAELLLAYTSALGRADARGLVEAEIIEALVTSGPVSTSEADLPAAKALRDHVEGVQDLRVPLDLLDHEQVQQGFDKLMARANLLKVQPVDPNIDNDAADAFAREADAMRTDGQASDADDHAELRAVNAS